MCRLVRSTSVATALLLALPTIKSPSQWPGSDLSAAEAGRSAMGRYRPNAERLACSARPRGLRRRRCRGSFSQGPGSRLAPAESP